MTIGGDTTKEMEVDARQVLPIYIAVDTSDSMRFDGKIEAAREIVPKIIDACEDDNTVNDKTRFCVLAFDSFAHVAVPMSRGADLTEVALEPSGSTSFTALFETLLSTIETDYRSFSNDTIEVYRPVVCVITDGLPNCDADKRTRALDALVNPAFSRRPQMVILGVGNEPNLHNLLIPYATVNRINGEPNALVVPGGSAAGELLSGLVASFLGSIVNTVSGGGGQVADEGEELVIQPLDISGLQRLL